MTDGKEYLIRMMTTNDTDQVEEFYNTVADIQYNHKIFEQIIPPRFTTLLLIEKDANKQTIVGISSSFRIWHDRFSTLREAYLALFGISNQYKSTGLGKYLLDLTLYVHQKYFTVVKFICDIPKTNYELFDFFRQNGFNGQRIETKFFKTHSGKQIDSVFMMKSLTDKISIPQLDNCNIEISEGIQFLISNTQTFGFFEKFFAKP